MENRWTWASNIYGKPIILAFSHETAKQNLAVSLSGAVKQSKCNTKLQLLSLLSGHNTEMINIARSNWGALIGNHLCMICCMVSRMTLSDLYRPFQLLETCHLKEYLTKKHEQTCYNSQYRNENYILKKQ